MSKKTREQPSDEQGLAPMPSFDWPKNVTVLSIDDLKEHDILWHISDNFEGEARTIFREVLHTVIALYCSYPVIKTIGDLSKYSKAEQAEVWRRALYIVGYNV